MYEIYFFNQLVKLSELKKNDIEYVKNLKFEFIKWANMFFLNKNNVGYVTNLKFQFVKFKSLVFIRMLSTLHI